MNDMIKVCSDENTVYKYTGFDLRSYYLDGTKKVYFTNNTHTIKEGKIYPNHFLNEDGSIIILNNRQKNFIYDYKGSENVHIFVKYNEYSDDFVENHSTLYLSDLNQLRLYDNVRKVDGSIFDDFIIDSKTRTGLNHYNYNFYLHPTAIMVDIRMITPERTEHSLYEGRAKSVSRIIDDPKILLPPIKLNADNSIKDGNHRYYMSLSLGFTHIPVIYS